MRVMVFDVATAQPIAKTDVDGMLNIAFSYDATRFAGERVNVEPQSDWPIETNALRDASGHVELRDTASGQVLGTFEATGLGIEFSSDGKLRSGQNIFDTHAMKKIRDAPIGGAAFVDGGKRILAIQSSSNPYNLWPVMTTGWCKLAYTDLSTGWQQQLGDFHGDGFGAALQNVHGYSPDSRWIVDRRLQLWRVPQ
jgi:hypothetical protein